MTKEEFLSLIRTPDEVIHQRPEAIASLVKEFPYCQALRYVYLLQLHGQDHISYAQQLKLTSAYAPDRKRLHQLLHPELMMHDSAGWNENIALENEGMMDTAVEKNEAVRTQEVEIPVDEPIYTNQENREEIIEETPVHASVNTSAKETEEEKTETQMDEDALSAEAIVIQRLKELNIWTEPETVSQKVEVHLPDEDIEEREETEVQVEIKETFEKENSFPAQIPSYEEEAEIEIFEAEIHLVSPLEIAVESNDSTIKSSNEITTDEKVLDPLEELILESIVATQVNNSDYLSEEKIEELKIVVEEKSTVIEIEPIPHQVGEKHSFAEWLHLNQQNKEAEVSSVENKKTVIVPNISSDVEIKKPVVNKPIERDVSSTVSNSKLTSPKEEITSAKKDETTSAKDELVSPKVVYVKSTTPKSTAAPTSTPSENSTTSPSTKFTEAVPYSPISLTPSDEDPDLIPGKKPIPDPSLVDTDPPKSKVPADQLIDKFIKQEPRITPSKSAFYSPVNMAKRSIIEPEDLVSETLANIYAQQGNFQKAISFYTKLSLRFPEKSRYFAALIKELENKLNT
jgi:hypothetical protein